MSQDLDWLVETSSNLASIHKVGNKVLINSSQRSSLGSARRNMSDTFAATFELAGAEVKIGEGYPGWKMNPDSEILSGCLIKTVRFLPYMPVWNAACSVKNTPGLTWFLSVLRCAECIHRTRSCLYLL